MLESGMRYEQISQVLGRTQRAVARRVGRLRKLDRLPQEIKDRMRPYTVDDFELMRKIREKGKTWPSIADDFFQGRPIESMQLSFRRYRQRQQNEKNNEQ